MRLKQGIGKKVTVDKNFLFTANDEAKICLNCTQSDYKGECKKFYQERKKIKTEK